MLRPLTEDEFPLAAALLCEGFPGRPRAFWDEGLQRLRRYAANAACGVPLGQFLVVGDEPVGIALTPASVRTRADGSRHTLVNLSSWYVREAHRWRAPLMLRALAADPRATYVDLTPVPQIETMLRFSGFRAVNDGALVASLPLCAALPSGGASVRELTAADRVPAGAPALEMLLAHRDLGCVPLLIEHDGGPTLIVYRRRPMRRMPGARLKYIGSHRALQRHLPALARHLLGRGVLFLTWDARSSRAPRWGTVHRAGPSWYAKGEIDEDCTDFVGTELCILGV